MNDDIIHYPPFRKIFYEEPAFNPALLTSKMGYGSIAHFKEVEKSWKEHGIKFSKDARNTKVVDLPDNIAGPLIPEEYKQLCEKTVHYFGRVRRVRPFMRVHLTNDPDRNHVWKPRIEALAGSSHGREVSLKDPWLPSPVCGTITPSSVFVRPANGISATKSRSRPLFPALDRIEIESSLPYAKPQAVSSPQECSPTRGSLSRVGFSFSKSPSVSSVHSDRVTPAPQHSPSLPSELRATGLLPKNETSSLEITTENSPVIDADSDRRSGAWSPAVTRSTTSTIKQHNRDYLRSAERRKIYTDGMNRVITLKLAENMAYSSTKTKSSTPAVTIGEKDLEYLMQRFGNQSKAKSICEQSTEKSLNVLTTLPEEYYDSDSLASDSIS